MFLYVWIGGRQLTDHSGCFGMNDFDFAVSCGSTSWLNQNLSHEAPIMASAERMWAGVQLHHKFSTTAAQLPLALWTFRRHRPANRDAWNTIWISLRGGEIHGTDIHKIYVYSLKKRADAHHSRPLQKGQGVCKYICFLRTVWTEMCQHTKPQSDSVCVVQTPGSHQRLFYWVTQVLNWPHASIQMLSFSLPFFLQFNFNDSALPDIKTSWPHFQVATCGI